MTKLTVQTIIYHEKELAYLPFLFASLKEQTFQDWEIIVVDNGTTGDVFSQVEEHLRKLDKPYRIIRSDENVGFSAGHNMAYKEVTSPFVLLQNPDMFLLPDVFEKMIRFLEEQPQVVAVAPRLMRWDFERVVAVGHEKNVFERAEAGFTSDVDAIGVRLFRNRRAVEWLTRQRWAKDSDDKDIQKIHDKQFLEVFGVSGAFPMYRKSILDQLLLPGDNLFDPTYHSYKEDLDLAYRLRNAGYTSYVLLDTVAYHDRTGAGPKKMSDWAAIRNKKVQSSFVRFHSYKNHLRTLYKNEYWQNVVLDLPFIFWYEFKKLGFILLTDPVVVLKGWKEILQHLGYTRKARKVIKEKRKMYWRGLRRWF